jgi:hypothetical protein
MIRALFEVRLAGSITIVRGNTVDARRRKILLRARTGKIRLKRLEPRAK